MVNDKHLNFDLAFLDETLSQLNKPALVRGSKAQSATRRGPNVKWSSVIAALGVPAAIVIYFIYIASENEQSKSPEKSIMAPQGGAISGNFRCSPSHQKNADSLKPNAGDEGSLISQRNTMEERAKEISILSGRIDTMKVNEYSQASIDKYNALINKHNALLNSFRRDFASFEHRINQYDARVKAYNDYLVTNCKRVP